MPRRARIQSGSGIYHVMLRGSNHQEIFYDQEDNEIFLEQLKRYKAECGFELFAWCLMGNHVHMLLRTSETPLSLILKKLGVAYVYRFNLKYQRCGHLFQDRFRSEAVEDDPYFLTVLRYILQNPVKAGICAAPEEYSFSSMGAYCGRDDGLTDTAFACSICGKEELLRFLREPNEDSCLELEAPARKGMSDQQAILRIREELGISPDYGKADREQLAEKLRLLNQEGISIRQLSRLSGIPKGIIERLL